MVLGPSRQADLNFDDEREDGPVGLRTPVDAEEPALTRVESGPDGELPSYGESAGWRRCSLWSMASAVTSGCHTDRRIVQIQPPPPSYQPPRRTGDESGHMV